MDKEKLLRTMIIEEILDLNLLSLADVLLLILQHKTTPKTETLGNIPEEII